MKMNIIKGCALCALALSFVACSKIDDIIQVSTNVPQPLVVGTCPDAKYLNESRAWDVTCTSHTMAHIGRIELSASGNYLFLPRLSDIRFEDIDKVFGAPARSEGTVATNPFRKHPGTSRAYGDRADEYPAGVYKKISEKEYELSGYGTLIVDNQNRLIVRTQNGADITFEAAPLTGYSLDEQTRRFSRTWELVQVERAYYLDDKFVKKRFLSQAEIEDDFVRCVVVSQFGSFVRYEWNGVLDDGGVWRWEDITNQVFQYAFNDEEGYGLETVYFYNDFAMFLEGGDVEENGVYYQVCDVLKTRSTNDLRF